MSAVPVSRFLTDFGTDVASGGNAGNGWDWLHPASAKAAASPAAKIDAAYADGFETGKMAAQAVLDAKLAEQASAHQESLIGERRRWAHEQGEKLAQQLTAGLNQLERQIAETTGRVLEPFLVESLRRRALAELSQHLEAIIAKTPGIALGISGPEDLVSALQDKLAGKACVVTARPDASLDVCVAADQVILKTRLATWLATMDEAAK
jgi:hypothetical protein